jgi:outer membrane lipoprotein-sorting protein
MRWLSLVVLVVVAGPAFGQEKEAEDLYRAMEKKIKSAKTVHLVFDGEVNGIGKKGTMKGDLRVAQGEKGKIVLDGDFSGRTIKLTFISDGKKVYSRNDEMVDVKDVKPDEKNVEHGVALVARIGSMFAAFLFVSGSNSKQGFDVEGVAPAKDFKLGAKEKIGKKDTLVVEYRVKLPDGIDAKTSVWIDAATHLPVKRETVTKDTKGNEFRISEAYSTFIVDGKIDTKVFELPK